MAKRGAPERQAVAQGALLVLSCSSSGTGWPQAKVPELMTLLVVTPSQWMQRLLLRRQWPQWPLVLMKVLGKALLQLTLPKPPPAPC